jgi:transcriptional regulator with XRE-family HTH domain
MAEFTSIREATAHLRVLRERRGLSSETMAAICGMSASPLRHAERGAGADGPTWGSLCKIAAGHGLQATIVLTPITFDEDEVDHE